MHFVVVGLSHKTAPIELRERLVLEGEKAAVALKRLLASEDVLEGMLLSTCNRTEVYLVAKHVQRAAREAELVLSKAGGFADDDLKNSLYVKNTDEAAPHLFRVTAGLDSMVVGEPQIAAQVKEAYTQAVTLHATGPYLNKLVHKALNVSKRIRTETGIGRHPVSVSYAAVLLAEKIFGSLRETRVLLLGAGEMGALAARHLIERRVGEVRIANRTEDKAAELAKELGGHHVSYAEVLSQLETADIIIASTGAEAYVIGEADVREAMRRRRNRPMFVIDIAVPRNVDPAVHSLENVYLYDIDHLQGIVEANLKEREKEARKAEAIIEHEAHNFVATLGHLELSPTIQQLSRKFELIRAGEMAKQAVALSRFSAEDREAMEAMTKAIVNKILHDPILLMKTEEIKEGAPKYSEILKKLFKLESES